MDRERTEPLAGMAPLAHDDVTSIRQRPEEANTQISRRLGETTSKRYLKSGQVKKGCAE
jgi:hypothetical protein